MIGWGSARGARWFAPRRLVMPAGAGGGPLATAGCGALERPISSDSRRSGQNRGWTEFFREE
jgi:hypothetical protein